MSNTNLFETVNQGLVYKSVRDYDAIVYDFLERNKEKLCEIYNIPYYNPTDMKKKFLKWCKRHEHPRLVEKIHSRPWFMSNFLSELNLT